MGFSQIDDEERQKKRHDPAKQGCATARFSEMFTYSGALVSEFGLPGLAQAKSPPSLRRQSSEPQSQMSHARAKFGLASCPTRAFIQPPINRRSCDEREASVRSCADRRTVLPADGRTLDRIGSVLPPPAGPPEPHPCRVPHCLQAARGGLWRAGARDQAAA